MLNAISSVLLNYIHEKYLIPPLLVTQIDRNILLEFYACR